ncbi:MAG TPA: hypothetical protein DCS07_15995, partial [Bdellovibrionales bacterium]|nr:hypothetical protein [Bdellovibrionales bacterium]
SIGGQAVIEGVMMRAPNYIAVAVRKPNQKIVIRNEPHKSVSARFPFLKRPVLRGVVTLLESMVIGINALSFSANIAAAEEEVGEELSGWAIFASIAFAIVLGMGLFVALPHFLTAMATSKFFTADSPWFHLLDGVIKMCILLAYVYLIALMKDIKRVFQYHGAEHKSIYAFEAGEELTVENARKHSSLHPRCGTSFLLFLVLISIVVFSAVFPFFGLTKLSGIPILNHTLMVLVKIVLMMPVAGLAYEFIKMCACRMQKPIFRAMIWPGMVLQRLTTREPADDQLEVALASLRQVLRLEKNEIADSDRLVEMEIASLAELSYVPASVAEFPEA